MKNPDERVYLQHILDAIGRIESYIGQVDEEDFYQRTLVQDGVIRQIEIVGEAVKHLTSDFRKRYPYVPWEDIAGMRDKLIHDYFGVDVQKVWDTAKEDVPVLKEQISQILGEM